MNCAARHFFYTGYRGQRRACWHYFYKLGLTVLLIGLKCQILAQDLEVILKNADEYYHKEQYHKAAQYYQIVVGLQSDDPEANYRLARCYQSVFNYNMAAYYYERTFELDQESYPIAPFYLAQMQKSIGNFKNARDGFQRFIQVNETSSSIPASELDNYIQQAELEIEGSTWAIEQLGKSWREMGFSLLPEPVNSTSNDYAAVAAEKGGSITITSGRKEAKGGLMDNRYGEHFTDNFRYIQQQQQWVTENASDHFDRTNTKFSDGVGTYNATGDKYYFTSCYEGNAYCKLYVIHLENGTWKNPRVLNDNVNAAGYDNKHPTLTKGGDTLIFVSNRPGGSGGNDLWFSVSEGGEDWNEPKPLPGKVNTPFNEASPFCYGESLLFFSSDGHAGIGGMDVFMAKDFQQSNGSIQNLGTPFNSGYDDSFFSIGTGAGYVSSNRPGGFGKFDIYTFTVPEKSQYLHQYLEETADGTQLRSRIRTNDGSNLFASRDEDQFYYDNLSADDRARMERILVAKTLSDGRFKPSDLSKEDFKYYNKLDIETKATIERLAQRRVMELEGFTSAAGTTIQEKLDWEYYQNIDDNEKEVIDRILNAKVEGRRQAMTQLNYQEQQYTIDSANRERIESKVQLKSLDLLATILNDEHQQVLRKLKEGNDVIQEAGTVSSEKAETRAIGYNESVKALGASHYWYYQALNPSQRADIHMSALRQLIISNPQLDNTEKSVLLTRLGLEVDQMDNTRGTSSEKQMAIEVRVGITNYLAGQLAEDTAIEDQIEQELIIQKVLLRQELELLAKEESDTRDLQKQMQSYIAGQQQASDPELENKIVEQFYRQSIQLPLLTPKASHYFNSLNPGQQLRVERLAAMVHKETEVPQTHPGHQGQDILSNQNASDQWYYLELSPQEREMVNEIVALGGQSNSTYSDQQLKFISGLTKLERDRIDRLMGTQPVLNFEVQNDPRISISNGVMEPVTEPAEKDTQPAVIRDSETEASINKNFAYAGPEIYFDFGQYQLRPEARKTLNELAEFIRSNGKSAKVVIDGHTDNIGSQSYNLELGEKRSLAAANFLQPKLNNIEVSTASTGELKPRYDNKEAIGRQMNRRVELKIEGIKYEPAMVTYMVRPNVTIWKIAEVTGFSADQIIEWNGLADHQLKSFQPIRLPAGLNNVMIESILCLPADTSTEESDTTHTVNHGDNLFKLAQRYHTTVQTLEEINRISASDLLPGQQIRVR